MSCFADDAINHHLFVHRLKSSKPRSSIVKLLKPSVRDGGIVRPHRDKAIRILRTEGLCKFTILCGCSRQEGPPYPALYSHVKNAHHRMTLSRIPCHASNNMLRSFEENCHSAEHAALKLRWWSSSSSSF